MLDIKFLEKEYLKFGEKNGIDDTILKKIEDTLKISLPSDFKQISKFFSGGDLGAIYNYDFEPGEWDNIVGETIKLRSLVRLPKNFVVLAEPPESIILMDVINNPTIIWCDALDIYNIKNKKCMNKPYLWENYSDFFYELILDEQNI